MKILISLFLFVLILSSCAPVTPTGTLPTPVPQQLQDFASQMVWSLDDALIALSTNTGLYVYDTKTYKQLAAFDGQSGSPVVFSHSYLAAVNQKGLFVWNLKDFSLLFRQDADDKTYFQNLAISPDEKMLVTAEQKQTRYWSLPSGKLIAQVASANFVTDMVFSGKDTLLLADTYLGTVQQWDVRTQKRIRALGFPKPAINFNLSQDGRIVVVDYGDHGFETWDVDTGELIDKYPEIIGAPGWNNLSGDAQTVVVWGYGIGENSGLSVWDLSAKEKIFERATPLSRGDGWRYGALNSRGTILAAGDNEGYIYFYDLKSGKKVGEIFLPYTFTI